MRGLSLAPTAPSPVLPRSRGSSQVSKLWHLRDSAHLSGSRMLPLAVGLGAAVLADRGSDPLPFSTGTSQRGEHSQGGRGYWEPPVRPRVQLSRLLPRPETLTALNAPSAGFHQPLTGVVRAQLTRQAAPETFEAAGTLACHRRARGRGAEGTWPRSPAHSARLGPAQPPAGR